MSPDKDIIIPDNLRENQHRPTGHPMPREIQSQKAQLRSEHQHGTNKDVKAEMNAKIGHEKA